MATVRRLSDRQLMNLYDRTFEGTALDPNSKIGQAHLKALRAIYEKGISDGERIAATGSRPRN